MTGTTSENVRGAGVRDGGAPVLSFSQVARVHQRGALAVTALDAVDLQVSAGEFVAVMGPSGSGKSTLLQLAGGMDVPTRGVVTVGGADLGVMSKARRAVVRRRTVGYIFQSFNLLPTLTAAENVSLPLELDGAGRRAATKAARTALSAVDLLDVADRFPDQLSGGQQQRVAIARALVGERSLVLADEPTGALDSATGETILGLLRDRADRGAAVVLVTHEARHAAWADRVIFLRDGRLVDSAGADRPELLLADLS